jgi:hypothetical protein
VGSIIRERLHPLIDGVRLSPRGAETCGVAWGSQRDIVD